MVSISEYLVWAEGILGFAAMLAALLGGITILQRRNDAAGKLMGWTALILCIGEALRLAAWLLRSFTERNAAFWSLTGRMAAALAVTVVCVLLSLLWEKLYEKKNSYYAEMLVRDLAGIRALGCVGPIVLYLSNILQDEIYDPLAGVPALYALIAPAVRCVPLLVIAAVVAWHWRKMRDALPTLQSVWLALVLSALFGVVADIGAVFVPALRLLWIAQAACLLWIVMRFVRFAGETGELH